MIFFLETVQTFRDYLFMNFSSLQFISVTQSYPTLCNCTDCSMPGIPVHHQHLELAQTHVDQVSDAVQQSHSLSTLSPPIFNLSKPQDLFWWVSTSHQVAKVLELQLQQQSFQRMFRTVFNLELLVWMPYSPQHHSSKASILRFSAFFMVQHSHPYMTTGKTIALTRRTFCQQSNVSSF